MLLLITGSKDGTSDRIVAMLEKNVFRLNFDLWKEYKIDFTPVGWKISNPASHEVTSETNNFIFLEYNANGQWTFLDVHNEYGLLDQVVHYITS